MGAEAVETGLMFAGLYLAAGLVIALAFIIFGAGRADAAAKSSSWLFRLAIIPGVILLWPFVLGRWVSGYQVNKNIHEDQDGGSTL